MDNSNRQVENTDDRWIVCKEYTNRWGQRMIATDYGYQFWKFKVKRRRKSA